MARSSQTSVRGINQDRVLDVLRTGPATQAEIARATGLSAATVSAIARELSSVRAVEAVESGGRGQLLRLSSGSGLTAGIAFGNQRALVAVGDLASRVLSRHIVPLTTSSTGSDALHAAVAALDELLRGHDVERAALTAVGVSLPAPLVGGGSAAQHSRWAGVDLTSRLAELLPCRVYVDNDANLGARAEYRWGELRGERVGAWVKASTGIGLGLVLDGHVHHGAKGIAGELGHVSTDPQGPLCWCGNRGCLELLAGSRTLVREYAVVAGTEVTARALVEASLAGDLVARRLVDDAGTRIGTALAGLVTLIDPGHVVVGGDLALSGDLLLEPLVTALRRHAMPAVSADVRVSVSALGDQAEVLGALALALDHAKPLVSA